jgi:hypothetical protein
VTSSVVVGRVLVAARFSGLPRARSPRAPLRSSSGARRSFGLFNAVLSSERGSPAAAIAAAHHRRLARGQCSRSATIRILPNSADAARRARACAVRARVVGALRRLPPLPAVSLLARWDVLGPRSTRTPRDRGGTDLRRSGAGDPGARPRFCSSAADKRRATRLALAMTRRWLRCAKECSHSCPSRGADACRTARSFPPRARVSWLAHRRERRSASRSGRGVR